jgi:hypothetical protein
MIRQLVRAGVLVLVSMATAAQGAPRRNLFDGPWTVLIVTERGSCDRAYRYGVQIVDGVVRYDGSIVSIVSFDGYVAANGKVQVTVVAGNSRAYGSGRMSRNFGQGKWQGTSGDDACTGYWEAERR